MHKTPIPSSITSLYRHLTFHIQEKGQGKSEKSPAFTFAKNEELFKNISDFIHERLEIWKKKSAGQEPPFTKDPILAKYRFCNIFREFDKQTIEFHTLLNPLRDDFPLWLLNMFYYRLVARTSTVQQAGLLSFNPKENEKVYERLMNSPRPRFGTPYVFPVSVILKSKTPTRELFITQYLPTIMKKVATEIQTWQKESVFDGVARILPLFGFNLHFLWTEVLIDIAYQFPEYIDLFKRFPIGPGALRTISSLCPDTEPSEAVALLAKTSFDTGITSEGKPLRLSAENWEGIGCEFRKYTNLKAGVGRKRNFMSKLSK
jgi:hypothetical protein